MEKEIVLDRINSTENSETGTKGSFSYGSLKLCDTLELHDENNKHRESHIPAGRYLCELINSPKFGVVYEVKGVPNRDKILIHWGNFAGDKDLGFDTDLLGCIAVGTGYGFIPNHKGITQLGILNSRKTFKTFMEFMLGNPFYLIVKD